MNFEENFAISFKDYFALLIKDRKSSSKDKCIPQKWGKCELKTFDYT